MWSWRSFIIKLFYNQHQLSKCSHLNIQTWPWSNSKLLMEFHKRHIYCPLTIPISCRWDNWALIRFIWQSNSRFSNTKELMDFRSNQNAAVNIKPRRKYAKRPRKPEKRFKTRPRKIWPHRCWKMIPYSRKKVETSTLIFWECSSAD